MTAISYVFLMILMVAIAVAISRWIFRINDIVKNLEELNAKMGRLAANEINSLPSGNPAPCIRRTEESCRFAKCAAIYHGGCIWRAYFGDVCLRQEAQDAAEEQAKMTRRIIMELANEK